MSHAITPDPTFKPEARETLDVAQPFVSLWLDRDVLVQVPLTPEGREYLHRLADGARFATVPGMLSGARA